MILRGGGDMASLRRSGLEQAMTDDEFPPDKTAAQKGSSERAPRHARAVKREDRARLDPSVQAHIGKQLRDIYDSVVHQPIPDRFLALLNEIDQGATEGDEDD
jgi:hypothetical protein